MNKSLDHQYSKELRKAIGNQANQLAYVQERGEYNKICSKLPKNSAYINKNKFVNPKNYLQNFKKYETTTSDIKDSFFYREMQEQKIFR